MIAVCKPRMFADHRGEFEAVEVRHRDVDEDDCDLVLRRCASASRPGRGLDQSLAKLLEHDLVAEQLRRLIVDEQDIHWLPVGCSSALGLAMQPYAKRRQQLFGIDRLGEIVRGAGLEAAFAIAFHRLRRQSDDRQPCRKDRTGSPAWSHSRPFPAS